LRLAADDDQHRFNEMLRTSMIGGVSRAVSGGLRDFVLREDPTPSQSLGAMQKNLAQCQATRRQFEEIASAESEIRGVYEAGLRMFHAAVHAACLRAEEQRKKLDEVGRAAREAWEAHEAAARRLEAAREALERASESVREAESALEAAEERSRRVRESLELAREEASRERDLQAAVVRLDDAMRVRASAESALQAARAERRHLRERLERLTAEVADASQAFQDHSMRAGLHRLACEMFDRVRALEPAGLASSDPTALSGDALQMNARLQEEIQAFTRDLGVLDGRVLDARDHARSWTLRHEALLAVCEVLAGQGMPLPEADPYELASRVLTGLPGWRERASRAGDLERASSDLSRKLQAWNRLRERVAAVLGSATDGAAVQAAAQEAKAAREVLDDHVREAWQRWQVSQTAAETCTGRVRALEEEVPRWLGVEQQVARLKARSGVDLRSPGDLDVAEVAWTSRHATLSRRADDARDQALAARATARDLESAGASLDGRLLGVCERLEWEIVASRLAEVPIEDAALYEARLGPLRDAILVHDVDSAARQVAVMEDRPDHVLLVGVAPPEVPCGEVAADTVIVDTATQMRVSRIPEQPVLGRAARVRRVEALRLEATRLEGIERGLRVELASLDGILADARACRVNVSRWPAPDPRPLLDEARRDALESAKTAFDARALHERRAEGRRLAAMREDRVSALLADAWMLDEEALPSRAARAAEDARLARAMEGSLRQAAESLAALESGIESLKHAPLDASALAALDATRDGLRGRRTALLPAHRSDVEARLDARYPGWRDFLRELHTRGLPRTPQGCLDLERSRVPRPFPPAWTRLNQHTAAAWIRGNAKAALGPEDGPVLEGRLVTHDNGIRIRPHAGLQFVRGGASFLVDPFVSLAGEIFLPQRAFLDGPCLSGSLPRCLLLVENLGVYVDLEPPPGWCVAHVPGWNTSMVPHLVEAWRDVPALLFGDLDPNGVEIARSPREAWPGLAWFTPDLGEETLARARPCDWPPLPEGMPPFILRLARLGRWVEQESLLQDPSVLGSLFTLPTHGSGGR
jgi:chromosome partition protein MukB